MRRILTLLLPLVMFALPCGGRSIEAVCLKSEYQTNPIGIDYPPQLSWRLQSPDKDVVQTAYRVLVASDEELLARNIGDVWDSGKVFSGVSGGVSTSSLFLKSRTRYYWKVKVWQGSRLTGHSIGPVFLTYNNRCTS